MKNDPIRNWVDHINQTVLERTSRVMFSEMLRNEQKTMRPAILLLCVYSLSSYDTWTLHADTGSKMITYALFYVFNKESRLK
jgi:hypothetical protein